MTAVSNARVACIREALNQVTRSGDLSSDTSWTHAIRKALTDLGHRERFHVAGALNAGANWGEWGFDLSWRNYGRGDHFDAGSPRDWQASDTLLSLPLVAEIEWGDIGAIIDDFEKVLVVAAEVRLLVCASRPRRPAADILDRVRRTIANFGGGLDTGCFLISIYRHDTGSFQHSVFDCSGNEVTVSSPLSF